MHTTRIPRETGLNVARVLKLLEGRKCLKKVPNKTVEYYSGDLTTRSRKARLELPRT